MSSWQDLIQVAMLGTDRQPLPRRNDEDPAAELQTIPDESNEKQLLDRIAVHAYRRRAAALPSIRLGALPVAAPVDRLPICNVEAARSRGMWSRRFSCSLRARHVSRTLLDRKLHRHRIRGRS